VTSEKRSVLPRGRPPVDVSKRTLGGRIRAARKEAKLSAQSLSARIGIRHQSLTEIERGETKPERRTLILLAQALETDFGDATLREHVPKRQRDIPVVGRVAAGKPIERIEPDRALTVGPDVIKRVEKVIAFEVEGESMLEDHILDSDILLCREVEPTRNAIAVVEFDDNTATVKRWRPKGQSVTLGSEVYSLKRIRRTFEVLALIRKMR
jgi:SOS-response transcriptional repressor LexA